MINYSFQNIPFSKQSLNKHKNLNDNTTNYNLSLGLNSLDSNLNKFDSNSNFLSLFDNYNLKKSNWGDSTVFNKLASNKTKYPTFSPIISNNVDVSRLNFNQTSVLDKKEYYNPSSFLNN